MKSTVKWVSIRRYGWGCPMTIQGSWHVVPLDSQHHAVENPLAGIAWEYISDCQDDCRATWPGAIICVDSN